ncbi:hypothetical protein RUM43_015109 [Polyplax serrata]|uniref:Uncharacterized protein n=1 Tax=Polyplax serrata TaxID=468196 RepID=A0AAN8PHU3_POLSC
MNVVVRAYIVPTLIDVLNSLTKQSNTELAIQCASQRVLASYLDGPREDGSIGINCSKDQYVFRTHLRDNLVTTGVGLVCGLAQLRLGLRDRDCFVA